MQGMILNEYKTPLSWQSVPDPECGRRDVILRVRANGLCATDLKIADGVVPTVSLPHILGHEAAGEVVEVGAEVRSIQIGDHVTIYPTQSCGLCDYCRLGQENYCLTAPRSGFEVDGGFSEYFRVPERNAVKIDAQVSWEAAAIIPDALASTYHATMQRGRIQAGETVVVVGLGGLGIHAVQMAAIMGANVIAVDIEPDKLNAAREFNPKAIVNSLQEDLPTIVKDLTAGVGADVVVECVAGSAIPSVLQACLSCLRLGGRLVVMGYGYGLPVTMDSADLIYGQWSILGTRASTLQDVVNVVRLVEDGKLKPMVSEIFPLEQVNEAMASLREHPPLGRIVLT